MLKLGIIGTGTIAHQFIQAAQLAGGYELSAVYSRKKETASQFAQPYGDVALYTDLEAFVNSTLDVIYLASPNSLHYQHALTILQAGKHLIVEKPAFSNPREFSHVVEVAKANNVLILEAARNYHEANLGLIADFLADKVIYGASFNFAQYSSRMKNLLDGIYDNAFQSKMSGGALVDLGIYEVYAAYKLFGQPSSVRYTADLLPTGVDVSGSGQLVYKDFHVSMIVRKNAQSALPSEIYTDQGTLVLNHIQGLQEAKFHGLDGDVKTLPLKAIRHLMLEEAQAFAAILTNPKEYKEIYNHLLTTAQQVNETLTLMRQDANIRFEADL
ncbi:Gfo/Idh/MocA family protein [Streptococcus merionis]|uniref:Oxidoreductase n=1 Tax=Streptococcus merionis TaxID=400065 RepID=A0A239SQQ3_9STRE|nr:Gfo/Idh/MocA family oxidoreductase [Streptococcus merionis]SNU86993.1 oxidoreductase [Streptococcus merionis]